MKILRRPHSSRTGFTLVEVMIASTIAVMALAGTMALLITALRYYSLGRDKVQMSYDIRMFTLELMKASRNAADFRIYDNFASRTQQAADGVGDMVAFLYTNPNNEAQVVRVVTFYRDLGAANNPDTKDQTLRKYDTGFQTAGTFGASWLPPANTRTTNDVVVQTTADSTSTQTRLFQGIAFGGGAANAIGVSGRIVYDNKALRRLQNNFDIIIACRS